VNCGQLAALLFTKVETAFSTKTMLQGVSSHHRQGFCRGSTVQAIKDVLVLPYVQIQLCVFYVLKAIHVSRY